MEMSNVQYHITDTTAMRPHLLAWIDLNPMDKCTQAQQSAG